MYFVLAEGPYRLLISGYFRSICRRRSACGSSVVAQLNACAGPPLSRGELSTTARSTMAHARPKVRPCRVCRASVQDRTDVRGVDGRRVPPILTLTQDRGL